MTAKGSCVPLGVSKQVPCGCAQALISQGARLRKASDRWVGALQPGLPAALEGMRHVTSEAHDSKGDKQFQTKVVSCDHLFLSKPQELEPTRAHMPRAAGHRTAAQVLLAAQLRSASGTEDTPACQTQTQVAETASSQNTEALPGAEPSGRHRRPGNVRPAALSLESVY